MPDSEGQKKKVDEEDHIQSLCLYIATIGTGCHKKPKKENIMDSRTRVANASKHIHACKINVYLSLLNWQWNLTMTYSYCVHAGLGFMGGVAVSMQIIAS